MAWNFKGGAGKKHQKYPIKGIGIQKKEYQMDKLYSSNPIYVCKDGLIYQAVVETKDSRESVCLYVFSLETGKRVNTIEVVGGTAPLYYKIGMYNREGELYLSIWTEQTTTQFSYLYIINSQKVTLIKQIENGKKISYYNGDFYYYLKTGPERGPFVLKSNEEFPTKIDDFSGEIVCDFAKSCLIIYGPSGKYWLYRKLGEKAVATPILEKNFKQEKLQSGVCYPMRLSNNEQHEIIISEGTYRTNGVIEVACANNDVGQITISGSTMFNINCDTFTAVAESSSLIIPIVYADNFELAKGKNYNCVFSGVGDKTYALNRGNVASGYIEIYKDIYI